MGILPKNQCLPSVACFSWTATPHCYNLDRIVKQHAPFDLAGFLLPSNNLPPVSLFFDYMKADD
jgi:hypothetical protein